MRDYVLIVIGAPATNMGSQAIIRGLAMNIKAVLPNAFIEVMTAEKCDSLSIPKINLISYRYSLIGHKHFILKIGNKLFRMLTGKNSRKLKMYHFRKKAKKAKITFIVGADNYDKSYNSLSYMKETNDFLTEIGVQKTVMFNCSFDSCDFTDQVKADLSRFKIITVRDGISYENAVKALPDSTIMFFPDVAFCMEPERVALPEGWVEGNMVGINLSSLITDLKYGSNEEQVIYAYKKLVDYILNQTTYKLCFIPHVKNNADLKVLKLLYDYVSDKDRAIIINHENYNAAQKKYIISKCQMFIGARTHSTIAAYSSCVPTLVIGYSVKSRGIARDLFGTSDGFVVPVQLLNNIDEFMRIVDTFFSNEELIRNVLFKTIPAYIEKAKGVQEIIKIIANKE